MRIFRIISCVALLFAFGAPGPGAAQSLLKRMAKGVRNAGGKIVRGSAHATVSIVHGTSKASGKVVRAAARVAAGAAADAAYAGGQVVRGTAVVVGGVVSGAAAASRNVVGDTAHVLDQTIVDTLEYVRIHPVEAAENGYHDYRVIRTVLSGGGIELAEQVVIDDLLEKLIKRYDSSSHLQLAYTVVKHL